MAKILTEGQDLQIEGKLQNRGMVGALEVSFIEKTSQLWGLHEMEEGEKNTDGGT